MKTTLHTSAGVFDDLKSQWNALVARSFINMPFNTWEWHFTWWNAYHPGDLWIITCHTDNDELVGIAPWFIETTDTGERIVRFIGHIDVTDYMDFIAEDAHRDAVYQVFAAFLSENTNQFDRIGLANILTTSPTYTAFPEQLRAQNFDVSFELSEVAPEIPLPATYDEYLDALDSKQRKEVRRKMRKAEGGLYQFHWYIVDDTHDFDEEIERFLKLMAAADQEKAEFLKNEQHVEFFRQLMLLAYNCGWLQIMFITIDGEDSAAYVNFDYGNRIYVFNSGLQPEGAGALSPGIVLLQYAIEHSIQNNKEVFDFLRGNEDYKYKMGGVNKELYQINARK